MSAIVARAAPPGGLVLRSRWEGREPRSALEKAAFGVDQSRFLSRRRGEFRRLPPRTAADRQETMKLNHVQIRELKSRALLSQQLWSEKE